MTLDEKIKWLENASTEEFILHYNHTLLRYSKFDLSNDHIIMENWKITSAEILKRLSK
ncbi:MAG: hypothetical protein IJ583_12010 [Firmicutes bacterium]|nr:hypothetical protein [Bacillota bacterium]